MSKFHFKKPEGDAAAIDPIGLNAFINHLLSIVDDEDVEDVNMRLRGPEVSNTIMGLRSDAIDIYKLDNHVQVSRFSSVHDLYRHKRAMANNTYSSKWWMVYRPIVSVIFTESKAYAYRSTKDITIPYYLFVDLKFEASRHLEESTLQRLSIGNVGGNYSHAKIRALDRFLDRYSYAPFAVMIDHYVHGNDIIMTDMADIIAKIECGNLSSSNKLITPNTYGVIDDDLMFYIKAHTDELKDRYPNGRILLVDEDLEAKVYEINSYNVLQPMSYIKQTFEEVVREAGENNG